MTHLKDKFQLLIGEYIWQLCREYLSDEALGFRGQLQFSLFSKETFSIYFEQTALIIKTERDKVNLDEQSCESVRNGLSSVSSVSSVSSPLLDSHTYRNCQQS